MRNKLINTNKETSGFFSIILEKLKVASVFILNKEGVILDMNEAVTRSFGYTLEDVVGRYFDFLYIEEDRKRTLPEIELGKVIETGSSTDNNYVLHKNGEAIWTNGESIYLGNETNEPYITKVVFNLNEQKKLEESLKQKNEELEKVNKDLDTFVYTASHDLKAPISNIEALILALFDELSPDSKDKEGVKEIMNMIQTSVDKFKITIDDLSAIGKAAQDKLDHEGDVSFKEILEDVKMNLQESIEEINPAIQEDFSQVPKIRFSKKNLRSIMQNLVSNAIKYHSPKRKPEIKISTEAAEANCVLLKVSDNGLGIKEEDKERIFSMYQRLHNHVEGTGVGMNIIKRIVDNNGGAIEVESEIDKGSTFKVYLKC